MTNDRTPFAEKYARQGLLETDTNYMEIIAHLQGMTGNPRTTIEPPTAMDLRPAMGSQYTVIGTHSRVPPIQPRTNVTRPLKAFEHLTKKRKMQGDYKTLTLSHRNSTTTDEDGFPLDV